MQKSTPQLSPSWSSRSLELLEQGGMMVVLIGLVTFFSFTVDNFFGWKNLDALLQSVFVVGIISCTMLFCLASGNFDLSVGTIVPCAGVVTALVMERLAGLPAPQGQDPVPLVGPIAATIIGIASGLLVGGTVGLVNGLVVAKAKINPLITTLATMQIVKGLSYKICQGNPVPISNDAFNAIGRTAFPKFVDIDGFTLFQITLPVWICIACFLLFGFLLQWTTFGRNTLAIGGNEEAARLAGIKVDRAKIVIFAIQGVAAALAGILLAARSKSGQPKGPESLELQVISACVLGGVSLTGGVGKMSFVVAGVFIMGVVSNAMTLKHMEYYDQYIVSGGILLAAVLFDRYKPRRKS
jgi:L-arabinose transport system permease protein